MDTYTVYLICRDPRVPWLPKLVAALVAAYALSPIDLIPDFVPALGYLDDLVLVPLGLALATRLVPPWIVEEHRSEARSSLSRPRPSRVGASMIVTVWILTVSVLAFILM